MTDNVHTLPFSEIKNRVRARLPKSAFEPQPLRLLWVPFWIFVALLAVSVILFTPAHWSIKLLMALIMGNAWAILSFLAHEATHGCMGFSDKVRRIVGNIAGFPLIMPAELWYSAHIRRHHAYTNRDLKDVDTLGLISRYEGFSGAQKIIDKFPGAGRWRSLLYYAYGFTYQNLQTARKTKGEKGKKIRQQMTLMATLWVLACFLSGPDLIYTVIVPFVVANAIAMGYISTQHWIRPLSNDNNAVLTTLGLTQPKWIEMIYCNNAYHLEHHLFPAMPFNKLPLVRQAFNEEFPGQLAVLPFWQAIYWVFKTPRTYADNNHLVDPRHPEQWFDLKLFERAIIDSSIDLSKKSVGDFTVTKNTENAEVSR